MSNLLIIAHSYLHPQWRGKLYSLSSAFRSVVVIHPSEQMSNNMKYQADAQSNSNSPDNLTFVFLKALCINSPSLYTYLNIPKFVWHFIRANPTCILLEEDPYSSVGILTLICVTFLKWLKPNVKLCLFSWDNLNRLPSNYFKRTLKALATIFARNILDGIVCGNVDASLIARTKKQYACPCVVLPYLGVTKTATKSREYPHQRPLTIGFIGRMVSEKGLLTLLESFNLIESSKKPNLMLVGSGPLLVQLMHICKTNSISAVCQGWVSFNEATEYLSQIDILVLPSLTTSSWKEQFGLVLPQAMLMGIPCIGSSSGAIPQVINNSDLIFSEGSKFELAKKLSMLINDAAYYESASLSAYNWALECFDDRSVGINYATFLMYILSRTPAQIFQNYPYGKIHQFETNTLIDKI